MSEFSWIEHDPLFAVSSRQRIDVHAIEFQVFGVPGTGSRSDSRGLMTIISCSEMSMVTQRVLVPGAEDTRWVRRLQEGSQ